MRTAQYGSCAREVDCLGGLEPVPHHRPWRSPEQAEALITDPETRWVVQDERTTKGFGLLIGQRWTLVVLHDDRSIYPVTMYPTQRGGMRHRRTP